MNDLFICHQCQRPHEENERFRSHDNGGNEISYCSIECIQLDEAGKPRNNYDSTHDTIQHIIGVQDKLNAVICNLHYRGVEHDKSKLSPHEKPYFDYMPRGRFKFDTAEYQDALKRLGKGLEHHYKNNSHHPQYYENGINGMSLLDLIEMLCDWMDACENRDDGDIMASIKYNTKRFGISEQLAEILANTVREIKNGNHL